MYKIAIAGAGAMGGRIGTQIKEAGYDVTLLDYWPEHVKNIKENGMRIQTENQDYFLEIQAEFPNQVNEQFDLIIILTKSMQAEKIITELYDCHAIKKDTAILSMMNGLGHDKLLSKVVPESQIFLAVTMWTASLKGPGQLLLEGDGSIELQRADGKLDSRTNIINDIFNEAKLNSKISDNVFKSIWTKATLNSVLNPLCSILGKKIGEFASYNESRSMIKLIIEEIVEVANKKGIDLDVKSMINKIESSYPENAQGLHYPSMYHDLKSGRLTEIDFLNGQIADYGSELGIPTPINKMMKHMIHQLENKN